MSRQHQPPTDQFNTMNIQGAYPQPAGAYESPGNAEFGADVHSGFDEETGYSHYQQHYHSSGSSSSGDPAYNGLPLPPRPGLHQSASQPRLDTNEPLPRMSEEFTAPQPRPRPRPGRAGAQSMDSEEPNPFLTYSRNSIYSSSQVSLSQPNRGSLYGGAASNKRMSRTLVGGSNALDMYRVAAKKTQDQRIQLEYAKFLIQSIENLEDPVVREDFNVTYSVYLPGSSGSSASLPGMVEQATEVDPENREKLISEAVYWIKHLQRKGNTEASFIAGSWFDQGKYGIQADKSKALQLYTYAAKSHHAAAAYRVAQHYDEKKSNGRAFSYYQMAAALGDVAANYRMAQALLDGDLGKKPNVKGALVYLRRSAELATSECCGGAYLLGQMYLNEYPDQAVYEHLFYDAQEAQKQLDKAAQLGSADAQYDLGWLFEFGYHDFPVDPMTSTHYYQLAAEQDHAKAQMALSGWYLSGGVGVPIDDRLAFDWGHRAAQQGLARAMHAMGYYYETGVGCPMDMAMARSWYEKAAGAGNEDARTKIRELGQGANGGDAENNKAALRRHVTQRRQKAVSGRGGAKRRVGGLFRDKEKDTNCLVM